MKKYIGMNGLVVVILAISGNAQGGGMSQRRQNLQNAMGDVMDARNQLYLKSPGEKQAAQVTLQKRRQLYLKSSVKEQQKRLDDVKRKQDELLECYDNKGKCTWIEKWLEAEYDIIFGITSEEPSIVPPATDLGD